jgi:YidC/Oxa1 family membrane protein insertase
MSNIFDTIFVQPLYNGFIYLIGIMPGGDVGFAIIVLTLIIRGIFYPAFAAQIRTTMGMQAIQGELDEINKKYKDNPEERGRRSLELFKTNKISPLAGFASILIQLPIFIALYFTFFHTTLPQINTAFLYPFVVAPSAVNINFLGILDLTLIHNVLLALIVGGLQYLVMYFSLGRTGKAGSKPLSPEKMAAQKMQQRMMLYVLPGVIAAITYTLPAAVGLYFAAGSIISLGQEWLIRRELVKKPIK